MTMPKGSQLFAELSDSHTISPNAQMTKRLEILLTDFLVATRAGIDAPKCGSIGPQLAINSSFHDADDIDWSVMTHPGSIIWPALLDSLITNPENASRFTLSAYAGYRTSATIAHFFGASHRKKWHASTTAGTLAATSTSSTYLNLSPQGHRAALENAASNMGGIAIADRRTGAAIFNRAAATSLGLLASRSGLPSATNIWEGDRGLMQLFAIDGEDANIYDGITTSGLRLFPYNGFIQSQTLAITRLAEKTSGDIVAIELGLHPITVEIVNGSVGGNYWDLKHGAASAWQVKDVTKCAQADPQVLEKISVKAMDIPISGAEVTLETTEGSSSLRLEVAPGNDFTALDHCQWQEAKWNRLIGSDCSIAKEFAQMLLNDAVDETSIGALHKFLL